MFQMYNHDILYYFNYVLILDLVLVLGVHILYCHHLTMQVNKLISGSHMRLQL